VVPRPLVSIGLYLHATSNKGAPLIEYFKEIDRQETVGAPGSDRKRDMGSGM
jgi:hypothetical protein